MAALFGLIAAGQDRPHELSGAGRFLPTPASGGGLSGKGGVFGQNPANGRDHIRWL